MKTKCNILRFYYNGNSVLCKHTEEPVYDEQYKKWTIKGYRWSYKNKRFSQNALSYSTDVYERDTWQYIETGMKTKRKPIKFPSKREYLECVIFDYENEQLIVKYKYMPNNKEEDNLTEITGWRWFYDQGEFSIVLKTYRIPLKKFRYGKHQ